MDLRRAGARRLTPALTWVVLALVVVAVYVAVVLGLGTVLGREPSRPSTALSVLATTVVAVAIEPLRRRVQRALRGLLGDGRLTPYEALSWFSSDAATEQAADDVLPRMAHLVVDAVGGTSAQVWLLVGSVLRPAASWPAGAEVGDLARSAGGALVATPPAAAVVPVRSGGRLLGALVVRAPAGQAITPREQGLLDDLARQAGLLVHNLAVRADLDAQVHALSAQAADLAASRARLVAAQDAERRRLERDIHDGAQQHLVALSVSVRLVSSLLTTAPDRARSLVPALRDAVDRADDTLRELARGVHPATLSRLGVVPALVEAVGSPPVPVVVTGTRQRFAEETEAAVYFSCLEAVQNALKHAAPQQVRVQVTHGAGDVRFTVSDDGRGFAPSQERAEGGLANVRDRVESLGGTVSVSSTPGAGTTVAGRMPGGEGS